MLLQRELYAVPSAAFCLGEEQIGAQQFNNSCTFCCFSPLHTNLDRRSTEPTEITPFLENFPDSTLSSPSRTANALILGLGCRFEPIMFSVHLLMGLSFYLPSSLDAVPIEPEHLTVGSTGPLRINRFPNGKCQHRNHQWRLVIKRSRTSRLGRTPESHHG